MGFFKNPIKAIKGFINNHIPGGKYITGYHKARQKRHYNASSDRYNNYAGEAQRNIESLSQSLQQSMQNLQSLEQQRYYSGLKGQQVQGSVSEYERGLDRFERQQALTAAEADNLQKAFESFKSRAPALANKIAEVEKLPGVFRNLYQAVAQQKESLQGLTEEEAGSHIKKHRQDVEHLKKQREEIGRKIRQQLADITQEHRNLDAEKANLEHSLERYKYQQDRLLQESSSFDSHRNRLQEIIQDYRNEQERINNEYQVQQTAARTQEEQLKSYTANAQKQLDALGRDAEWRRGKYQREARKTGLVQGAALGIGSFVLGAGLGRLAKSITAKAALAGKAGSTPLSATVLDALGSGLRYAAPLLGIGQYMHASNIGHKPGYQPISLGDVGQMPDLSQIARYGPSGPKVNIPELGGLKQSLAHFNMPTVPALKDLPPLHEALGKIVNIKDIEGLSLGLPGMTSASGRKYSTEVLYNPDFIKKLKKVSRRLGRPYLQPEADTKRNIAYV